MKNYFNLGVKSAWSCWLMGVIVVGTLANVQVSNAQNDAMMQAFYWNVPVDSANHNGNWWNTLSSEAQELKDAGITGLWIPCPVKGNWGITDMGYGVYDHYDLGNYNQRGTVETRFGSRQELENMISTMHQGQKIDVYADVILNHMFGNEDDLEANPAVKAYEFGEAHNGVNVAYPTDEIYWVIPDASPGDYYIQVKGFNLDWNAASTERGYDVNINWTGAPWTENGNWESEPNNGNGQFNVFPGSGYSLRAHADYSGDIDEYKVTLTSTHDITIRLIPKRENFNPWQWVDASTTNGFYPVNVWYNGSNLAGTTLEARTYTGIHYVTHTGAGEPNYSWNYSDFHPSDANDWLGGLGTDEIITNTKLYGNDLNTFDATVVQRLDDWGYWLANQINFDGFRLDFVRGFQESFVSQWINNLPLLNGQQRFIVGEYWGADYRIKNWINAVASGGAAAHAFDFPLKFTLKDMCNGDQSSFNMAWLNHAGMVRNDQGNAVPGTSIVTFVDNHDTGKEHDKWVTKDFKMAYAYILTHEGRPCIFYPHYFGVTQYDNNDPSQYVTAPSSLKEDINKLIFVRKTYLGGTLTVLSEVGNPYPSGDTYNVYVARRQGNGSKAGAIVVINNHNTDTKGLWVDTSPSGYENLANQVLVNAFDPTQTTQVYADGRAWLSAPARGYSVWVKQSDYVTYTPPSDKMAQSEINAAGYRDIRVMPNPAGEYTTVSYPASETKVNKVLLVDFSGRVIADLGNQNPLHLAGRNVIRLNTSTYAPGVYFLMIEANGTEVEKKFTIVR